MILTEDAVSSLAPPTVLIIEAANAAEPSILNILGSTRMPVIHAPTGGGGLAVERSERPDVVVVDLELPKTDGLKLVLQLRCQSQCGIIVISSECEPNDRIVGLEIGADHYICKPPQLRELVGRIRAVSRRINAAATVSATDPQTALLGKLTVDIPGRTLRSEDGNRLTLTTAEFDALGTMLAANGAAVSREHLSAAALRRPWRYEDRAVDQLIFSLRQKLAHVNAQSFIHSVRGQGYLLAATA